MPASAEIDIGIAIRKKTTRMDASGVPFRIALLGDFGGRSSRGADRWLTNPLTIDSGNLEETMELIEVGVRLSLGGTPFEISFSSPRDFHPDSLQERLPLFQAVARLRAQLADPGTFPAAAAFLGSVDRAGTPQAVSPGSLGSAQGGSAAAQRALDPAAGWDDFLRRSVAAHLTPGTDPSQAEWIAAVDAAAGTLMRACLAHPAFQNLEAAWRSVIFLLQRLDTRANLRIELIDVTKEELVGLEPSGWSAAACLHSFAPHPEDCRLLAVLAAIGRRAGGPVLTAIDARLAGCASIAETPDPERWHTPLDEASETAWRWLRADPDARWLGVTLPRFLLRLPYGPGTGQFACIPFEEMPSPPVHDAFLWGSGAVACVCLLGHAFLRHGWNMRPGQVRRLEGLPVHTYFHDGERLMTPPAEVWLSEYRAERIVEYGAMPLASPRASDSLRMMHFQSAADPPAPLAGPWEPPMG